jgi:hypothetical protein
MKRIVIITALAGALLVPATASAHDGAWRFCGRGATGLGVVVNHHTSCAFGHGVHRAAAARGFARGFAPRIMRVSSSTTGRTYTMRRYGCGCSSWRPYTYRGGNGAAVRVAS